MRTWGARCRPAVMAGVLGALVAVTMAGAPVPAFADDATPPPPSSTTEPAAAVPGTDTPPATLAPAGDATAADAPPVAQLTPTLTATPSTDLVNHQLVTVAGAGFTPNASIGWAVCKNGSTGQDDCDLNNLGFAMSNSSGAFTASFTVHRILYTANGQVDCATAPETCTIGAAKSSDPSEKAGAPLTFDPSVPLPPPPTLLAGPTTNLIEGQSVAVFGGGFLPNSQVFLVQCVVPASAQNCLTLSSLTAAADGGFITTVQVHRTLFQPPFGSTDCAASVGTCQLTAVSIADYDYHANVPLGFDPAGPSPTTQVTVTPDTGLLNFQSVALAGSGFASASGVQIVECKTGAGSLEDCVETPGAFAPTSATGTFSTQFSVRRVLHLAAGDFDCAGAAGACSIVSSSFGPTPAVVATPISFDGSVPPPPPPAISVAPATDLVQGQSVTVTGSGFAPAAFVDLGQCLTGSTPFGYCSNPGGASVFTDANGAFSTSFLVRRGVLDYTNSPPAVIDCASAAQLCSVTAFAYEGGDSASAPVDFDASVPIHVPDVSVSPQFDLPDRALVDVHTSGFAPGEQVLVSQCDADAPAFGYPCTNGPVNILTADANGVVDTSLRVHRTLTYFGGLVVDSGTANCADAVGECVIRAASLDDPLAVTDVPLGFDPTAVAPPPVITTSPAGPFTDGEQVVVHGSGFTPGATLGLAQCAADGDPNGRTCDSQPGGLFDPFFADQNGEFTRTVTIHAEVQTTDATIDCAGGTACMLFAANRNDYGAERASDPITFAPGGVAGVLVARSLAFTGAGSSTRPLTIAGFGLVLAGGALVLVSRRRRLSA